MDKSLEELESELSAKLKAVDELKADIERKRLDKAMIRKSSLTRTVRGILETCADSPVHLVQEVELDDPEGLPTGYGNKIVVTVHSAYERKGYVSTNDGLDMWNDSYPNDECVKLSVYVSRDLLEERGVLSRFREEINGKD